MVYFDFEPGERYRSEWSPPLDVYENNAHIVIRVELPGVDKSGVSLAWRDGTLTISGTKHDKPLVGRGNRRYVCAERQYGHFRRDVSIRAGIDFEHAMARFRSGVLEIRLPKTATSAQLSRIPID